MSTMRGQRKGRSPAPYVSDERTLQTKIGQRITPKPNGCWEWTGAKAFGYGYFSVADRKVIVHRFIYETLVGPIPKGIVLHHACENRCCCNPAHLEPMTNGDHVAHHAALRRQLS